MHCMTVNQACRLHQQSAHKNSRKSSCKIHKGRQQESDRLNLFRSQEKKRRKGTVPIDWSPGFTNSYSFSKCLSAQSIHSLRFPHSLRSKLIYFPVYKWFRVNEKTHNPPPPHTISVFFLVLMLVILALCHVCQKSLNILATINFQKNWILLTLFSFECNYSCKYEATLSLNQPWLFLFLYLWFVGFQ